MGGKDNNSSFSSIDSSSHPAFSISSLPSSSSSSSSSPQPRGDLSTDLRLGLGLSSSLTQHSYYFKEREQVSNWPPIKPLLRSTLTRKGNRRLFVKVYMEGIPIGRKLDLYAHKNYDDLTNSLGRMFGTSIMCSNIVRVPSSHVLTYEDKEGDWMMGGDVPWELFLTSVKRLKITRAAMC